MTVIIKELIIKTTVIENGNKNLELDTIKLKNEIVKDCLYKLKKTGLAMPQPIKNIAAYFRLEKSRVLATDIIWGWVVCCCTVCSCFNIFARFTSGETNADSPNEVFK